MDTERLWLLSVDLVEKTVPTVWGCREQLEEEILVWQRYEARCTDERIAAESIGQNYQDDEGTRVRIVTGWRDSERVLPAIVAYRLVDVVCMSLTLDDPEENNETKEA